MVLINRRKIVFNENIQIFFSSVSHICKHMISVEDYESRDLPDNNWNEAGELVSGVTFDTQKFNKDAANVGLVKPVNKDSLTPSPEKKTRTVACRVCPGCVAPECGTCKYCLDKPKFGGSNKLRRKCVNKVCRIGDEINLL